MSAPRLPKYAIAPLLAVDADGYCWRVFEGKDHWSMCPVNPDNEPIPEPVTYFVPVPTIMDNPDNEPIPEPVTYYVPVPTIMELRDVIGACALRLEPMTTSDAIARAIHSFLAGSTERKA